MAERWGALPLGELHAEGACYRCGQKGLRAQTQEMFDDLHVPMLRRTLLVMTRAWADVCVDVIACERRRYKTKNP
jgi:hypothetical protein